jgi:two-component system sensor histidine kinase KdpD
MTRVGTAFAMPGATHRQRPNGTDTVGDGGSRQSTADRHDDALRDPQERVVVALPGGPEGETLIRRASRVAQRSAAGDLMAVHVLSGDDPPGSSPTSSRAQRTLVEALGGSYHQVVGDDVPGALLDFARGVGATQLVIGSSSRSRWARALRGGISGRVVADSGDFDVHIVPHAAAGSGGWRLPPLRGALTVRRRVLGFALATVGVPLVTALCLSAAGAVSLSVVLLAFLLLVLAVALVGGLWPALAAAVLGGLAENWFFVDPRGALTVRRIDDVVSLLGGLIVAATVATVVDRSARRATAAARSRAETALLASLSRSVLAGNRGPSQLLEQLREAFGLRSVAMIERGPDGDTVIGSCGSDEDGPDDDELVPVTDQLALRLTGRPLPASERRVLLAFAEQTALALQQERLAAQAAEADRLAAGNSMRTALLAAVSHDLRTPLAGIKAASSALRSDEVDLSPADRGELVTTIDESADRLAGLVDNLLDMSRLQAGAVSASVSPTDVTEVVDGVMRYLDPGERTRLVLDWTHDLPAALADTGLLERVLENLVSNALRHAAGPVRVTAGAVGERIEVGVTDRGPGIRPADRDRLFAPFQRLGDAPSGQGVGLGLAVARGLTEAMGGTLVAEDTPGGGLTMVVSLAAAPVPPGLPQLPDMADPAPTPVRAP